MPRSYVIAVGGTGARCLEAIIYLAAAGLFDRPLYVLMIDPCDQTNGNGNRTRQLIEGYDQIHLCTQPSDPRRRGVFRTIFPRPVLFQVPINRTSRNPELLPYFWNNPNLSGHTFGRAIEYDRQEQLFKNFLELFYERSDLEMPLDVGYRGRTSVGAVALKLDLERTQTLRASGLQQLLANLQADLLNEETRVFVMGSVFGGTGAAAIPTLSAYFNNLDATVIGANKNQLRYGCAMMIPYFSFPKSTTTTGGGPTPDSDNHIVATKAALFHYAHVPPSYQHVYLIGAPEQRSTAERNEPGGENQANSPHYAELLAALAALDFFTLEVIRPDQAELHFADDMDKTQETPVNQGIRWNTLPVRAANSGQRHEQVKRRLVAFATFAYFYKNFLHRHLVERQDYLDAPWYRDNFRHPLSISSHRESLNSLHSFADSFLRWLHTVGMSGGANMGSLFRWEGLLRDEISICMDYIGYLTNAETGFPRYLHDGYDKILKKLDGITLDSPGTNNAAGLLIYLLYQAIMEFCLENYRWSVTSQ